MQALRTRGGLASVRTEVKAHVPFQESTKGLREIRVIAQLRRAALALHTLPRSGLTAALCPSPSYSQGSGAQRSQANPPRSHSQQKPGRSPGRAGASAQVAPPWPVSILRFSEAAALALGRHPALPRGGRAAKNSSLDKDVAFRPAEGPGARTEGPAHDRQAQGWGLGTARGLTLKVNEAGAGRGAQSLKRRRSRQEPRGEIRRGAHSAGLAP